MQNDVLKNYILSVVNDSTFIQIIAEYPKISAGGYDIQNIKLTQVYGDDLLPAFSKCGMTLSLVPSMDCYSWTCDGGANHASADDPNCNADNKAGSSCVVGYTYVRGSGTCGGGGDSGGTSSGGGGGGYNVPIDPVESLSEIEIFYNELLTYLNTFIQSEAQANLRQEIELYLQDELYSNAATNFANEVIRAKWEDENAEIDFQNKSIYNSSVPECLKEIIDRFKPDGNGISVDVTGFTTGIYNELNLAGDILELFDNDANYGLKFKVASLPANRFGQIPNAHTASGPTANNGRMSVITFDQNYVNNATDLALARTVIHELIHAYIKYQLVNQPGGDIGRAIDELFAQIFSNLTPCDPQHVLMANSFVDAMAHSLEQWHNDPGVSSVEYTRMAWSGGMRKSEALMK